MISVPNTNISRVFAAWISLEFLIILFSVAYHGGVTLDALHTTARFSGRLSLIAFSTILLMRETPTAHEWVSEKPFLLFATIHGIHLVELLAYVVWSGTELIPIRVLGGFVAYAFVFAMPLLPHQWNESKRKAIENLFFTYIWLIFFLTYLPRVMQTLPYVGGTFAEHVGLFSWVIALAIIKLGMIFRNKLAS